jgi:hypothetical protein
MTYRRNNTAEPRQGRSPFHPCPHELRSARQ